MLMRLLLFWFFIVTAAHAQIDWRSDLEFLKKTYPSAHVAPFHAISKPAFNREVDDLIANLPRMKDRGIVAEVIRIGSSIGDSHSGVSSLPNALRFEIVPLKLYLFADGLGVQAADAANRELVGAKILRINGHSAAEVVSRMKEYTDGTNDMSRSDFVFTRLIRPELLYYAGMAASPSQYEVEAETRTGKRIKRSLTTLGRDPDGAPKTGGLSFGFGPAPDSDWLDAAPADRPLWLSHQADSFFMTYLSADSILFVQCNVVQDAEGEKFADFFASVAKLAKEKSPKALVLDLRLNGGGDNTLLPKAIEQLVSLPIIQAGKNFYVLIGRRTQSAAQNFVNQLELSTKPVFVGEPTGESPNHYGDPKPLELPSSKVQISLSTIHWLEFPGSDVRIWTQPQIRASLRLIDYLNGFDPALTIIKKRISTHLGIAEFLRIRFLAEEEVPAYSPMELQALFSPTSPNG